MSDKKPMPVPGGGSGKGKPDGVSGTPGSGEMGRTHGRVSGGESSGGAYPNPHTGKEAEGSGSQSHGGQTEIAYYGGDNPNATTEGRGSGVDSEGGRMATSVEREPHSLEVGERTVEVVNDSGVAAAEATGKIATDAPYDEEQHAPGAG
jgi:hypothetical protein